MTTRFETFSFLPPLSADQLRKLTEKMVQDELVPLIEFMENPGYDDMFWRIWPLGDTRPITATWLLGQLDSCARRHPYACIRLSGLHKAGGTCKTSFVVKAPVEN